MNDLTTARNPTVEAEALLSDGIAARTLEPGRPAVTSEPFFADDPAVVDADGSAAVTPTTAGAQSWDQLAKTDPTIAEFAAARWLGAWRSLPAVPAGYVDARRDFHRLAYSVVAAARLANNGKFGLRYTAGGFGTPFFGADEQVRMVANVLVHQTGDSAANIVPASIDEAAAFLGVKASTDAGEHDSPPLGDTAAPLALSPQVGEFLGEWFGFATSVLEELRLVGTDADDVGRVQLWPGHFDPATELGGADAGHRATYGGSPGDDSSDEPYLYVGAWGDVDKTNPFWNAASFNGATLPYASLVTAKDPRSVALDFYRKAFDLLQA